MAAKNETTPVDALLFGDRSRTKRRAAEPERERAASGLPRFEDVAIGTLYRDVDDCRQSVDGKPESRTTFFTPSEGGRIEAACHGLGGVARGNFLRFAALALLERVERLNGGEFPPIPHRR